MFEGVDFSAILNIITTWFEKNFDMGGMGGGLFDKLKELFALLFTQPPVV